MTTSELIELLSLGQWAMEYYSTLGDATRFDLARSVVDKCLAQAEKIL